MKKNIDKPGGCLKLGITDPPRLSSLVSEAHPGGYFFPVVPKLRFGNASTMEAPASPDLGDRDISLAEAVIQKASPGIGPKPAA